MNLNFVEGLFGIKLCQVWRYSKEVNFDQEYWPHVLEQQR